MASASTIKTWYVVHKWTSLICTAFLLIICLTACRWCSTTRSSIGWMTASLSDVPAGTPRANFDKLVAQACSMYPAEVVDYLSFDPDEPQAFVGMAKKPGDGLASGHAVRMDARTGDVLLDGPLYSQDRFSFMGIMLSLHVDLFASLPGELASWACCSAWPSCRAWCCGPFMKKLEFGTVRASRSTRLKWLDLHNLLGIVTLVWAFVVGLTGVVNELSTPLFRLWQSTELVGILEPTRARASRPSWPRCRRRRHRAPGHARHRDFFIAFPGNAYGSPHHYLVWMRGDTRSPRA